MTVSTLSLYSPVVTDPAEPHPPQEVRRCSVDVVAVGDGGSRCAPSSRSRRWRGRRSSAPLFATIVWVDPARPPQRHLAHLRYNFLYWCSSPGCCMRVFFYATTPQLPRYSSQGSSAGSTSPTIIEEMPLENVSRFMPWWRYTCCFDKK